MKENDKLINAIIDLALELKGMRKDMNQQLGDLNNRVGKLEKQQEKTNILLAEHSRSIIALAHRQDTFSNSLETMIQQQKITNERIDKTNERLGKTNEKLDKTNEKLTKNADAILILAEKLTVLPKHEKRINKLERALLK